MKVTIVMCHWKTGKMTAYAVAQFLKYKGNHDVDIIVVDNNPGDGSTEYLTYLMDGSVAILENPKGRFQSQGVGIDLALPFVKTDYFIVAESDSFPTEDNWLDYYEYLIKDGVECAGSELRLSGGTYLHPCGAFYKKRNWLEAKADCEESPYHYFPNMALKEAFQCHVMIHSDIYESFLSAPEDFIELSKPYKPYSIKLAKEKEKWYSPTKGPFHDGRGGNEESIRTYGYRNIKSEAATLLQTNKKLLRRIGYEPGQKFCYWHFNKGKKVVFIPTETKWINDQEGTQQEYTLMSNGFKHLWGISAWSETDPEESIYAKIKRPIPDQLYATLPDYQKIPE